jgi:hypothetical protein
LLLIPVAMAAAFTAREALQIGYGFLAGCLVVLVLSFLSFFILLPPPFHQAMDGVPMKDNAVQSGCFALCAFALALGCGLAGIFLCAAALTTGLAFTGAFSPLRVCC